MSDHNLPSNFAERAEFVIPGFGPRQPVKLSFDKVLEGERRLIEARVVNGATYSDLEFSFNEGYRQAKTHLSTVGYEIVRSEKLVKQLRAQYILDEYQSFIKEKKINDNSTNRDAFLELKEDYQAATDRVDMLKAIESYLEVKIRVFEKVCQYMRKEIDIQIRSGISSDKGIR